MSIAVNGSVHSIVRRSPAAMPVSAFLVRSAGRGHLSPRRLSVFSAIPLRYPVPRWVKMRARARQDPMESGPEQKIARLTPLAKVIAALDDLAQPVAPREVASADAVGFVLASDVAGPSLPARATALGDGWAVKADEL